MYTAIRWWHDDFTAWCVELAERQGRIAHLFVGYFQAIPFLIREDWYYQTVKTLFNLFTVLAFYWTVRVCSENRTQALLSVLFYLAALCHPPNHSLLTGYIGYIHLVFVFRLVSLLCFDKFLRGAGRVWGILSLLLFLLTLGGEDSPLYLVFFLLIAWCRSRSETWKEQFGRVFLRLLPFILLSGGYMLVASLYRSSHPSQYAGNVLTWSAFSFSDYCYALYTYTIHVFPGLLLFLDRKYFDLMEHYYSGGGTVANGWRVLWGSMQFVWLIRATILFVLVLGLGRRAAFHDRRTALFFGLAGLILLVLPNAALSLSAHYQDVALTDRRELTHYTYFLCFALGLLFTFAYGVSITLGRTIAGDLGVRTISVLFGLFAAFCSLCNDCTNHYVVRSQEMSTKKWESFEAFLKTEKFQRVPEGATLYAPSLWESSYSIYYILSSFSGAHLVPLKKGERNYWEKYCHVISGKGVKIVRQLDPSILATGPAPENLFYLRYDQEEKDPEQSLVFARISDIDVENQDFFADAVAVYSYGRNDLFRVLLATRSPTPGDSRRDLHSIPAEDSKREGVLSSISIEKESIDLDSVSVTYY